MALKIIYSYGIQNYFLFLLTICRSTNTTVPHNCTMNLKKGDKLLS